MLKTAKVALEAVDKFVALATFESPKDSRRSSDRSDPTGLRTDSPTPGILRLGSSGFSQVDGGAGLSMINQGSQGTSRLRRSIRLPGGSSIAAFCTSASLHCRNLIQKSTPCPALMLKHTAVCKESTHRTNIYYHIGLLHLRIWDLHRRNVDFSGFEAGFANLCHASCDWVPRSNGTASDEVVLLKMVGCPMPRCEHCTIESDTFLHGKLDSQYVCCLIQRCCI